MQPSHNQPHRQQHARAPLNSMLPNPPLAPVLTSQNSSQAAASIPSLQSNLSAQSQSHIYVNPLLQQLQQCDHQVTHIIEVKFKETHLQQSQHQQQQTIRETLFKAVFGCACCPNRQEWLTKEKLVFTYLVNEDKILEIELSAEKERKERETRRNAQMIQTFLQYKDILCFQSSLEQFQLIKFSANSEQSGYKNSQDFCLEGTEEEIAQLEEEMLLLTQKETYLDELQESNYSECSIESDSAQQISEEGDNDNDEDEDDDESGEAESVISQDQEDSEGIDSLISNELQRPTEAVIESSKSQTKEELLLMSNESILQQWPGSESPACCSSQDHKDCITFRSHRQVHQMRCTADILCKLKKQSSPQKKPSCENSPTHYDFKKVEVSDSECCEGNNLDSKNDNEDNWSLGFNNVSVNRNQNQKRMRTIAQSQQSSQSIESSYDQTSLKRQKIHHNNTQDCSFYFHAGKQTQNTIPDQGIHRKLGISQETSIQDAPKKIAVFQQLPSNERHEKSQIELDIEMATVVDGAKTQFCATNGNITASQGGSGQSIETAGTQLTAETQQHQCQQVLTQSQTQDQ